jgi:protease-4
MVDAIASGRHLTTETAAQAIERGPVGAEEAKKANLIDKIAYSDDILAGFKHDGKEVVDADDYNDSSSKKDDISLLSLISLMTSKKSSSNSDDSKTTYPKVAVVYAVGDITLGSNEKSGFSSSDEIASQDFNDTLDEIQKDDDIKAVIMRVNSPGGSAFASDLIWHKVQDLKAKKPVIVTMSNVAASGGYYISMGATRIIAQPGTITGSIGVVGGKPNLANLYHKLGVNKTSISKGRYTGLFSETTDFSADQKKVIEDMMKRTYDDFVNKAAQGRKKSYAEINDVAQGRVWTGAHAKEVGLVDELGGMSEAIADTKQLIGLQKTDKVQLITYPKEQSFLDVLQKTFGASATAHVSTPAALQMLAGTMPLPAAARQAFSLAVSVSQMFQHEQVLAVMPFTIHF